MILRPIEARDNLAVKQLIQTSLTQAGLALPGTAYFDPSLADLTAFYAAEEHGEYWVIEAEGEIIGGVGIAAFPQSGVCELQKLYLYANYRGQGLADQLMETALTYAQNHYQFCYLETHHTLSAARRLYDKYDFQALTQPLLATEHTAMTEWYLKDLNK